jgi:hypothetical protein
MRFSTEPTREMVFCTTAESELLLQKHLITASDWKHTAATMAVNHPNRIYEQDGGFMRFWNWDASDDAEHPIVGILLNLVRTLPEDQYRLLRIICDSNELEEAGNSRLFEDLGIHVIMAPRIIF